MPRGRRSKALSKKLSDLLEQQAADKPRQPYRPPHWAWNLLRAFLDPSVPPTVTARCASAGITRDKFYRYLKKPEFVEWLDRTRADAVVSDALEVRQAHLRKCLTGDLEAIRLWYERYDKDFAPTQRHIFEGPEPELDQLPDESLEQIAEVLAAAAKKGGRETVN